MSKSALRVAGDLALRHGHRLIGVLGATWRMRHAGGEHVHSARTLGHSVLFVFTHGVILPLAYAHRGRGAVVLISESRDGEMIARLAEYLGWRTVRGSSSHGGRVALGELVAALRDGPVAGHIVDGPRGPAGKIKPGIAVLAQRADARIVPVYVAYARAWQARSWDRFQVPKPWSAVLIRFGRLIDVPAELTGTAMDEWCADLDAEFAGEYARAVADVGGPGAARVTRAATA